jgi:hypothetical protein
MEVTLAPLQPEMESTLVNRTTDSSSVGTHYADLGQTAVQQVYGWREDQEWNTMDGGWGQEKLYVTNEQMDKFMVHGGGLVWLAGNGEECVERVLGKVGFSQHGPHELRIHITNGDETRTFRMVYYETPSEHFQSYFEPAFFGKDMLAVIDSCDVE